MGCRVVIVDALRASSAMISPCVQWLERSPPFHYAVGRDSIATPSVLLSSFRMVL